MEEENESVGSTILLTAMGPCSGDEDADCERSDTDQSEKIFYPPAGQESSVGGSSFSVKLGLQNSLSQPSSGSSSGFIDLVEARRRLKSRGAPKDLQQGKIYSYLIGKLVGSFFHWSTLFFSYFFSTLDSDSLGEYVAIRLQTFLRSFFSVNVRCSRLLESR